MLVRGVTFSADGKLLASGSWDSTAKVWDLETGKERVSVKIQENRVIWSVALSPDGKTLAGTCDYLKPAQLWDITTGAIVGVLAGHTKPVSSIVFSPDGKTIATGSSDNTVMLWDMPTAKKK